MAEPHMQAILDGAIIQHEIYLSWVRAGFTEEQALQMLCAVLINLMQAGRGPDDS